MLRSLLAGDLDRLERGKNKRVEQNKQIYCRLERSYLVNAIALYYKICLFLFILKKSRTLKNRPIATASAVTTTATATATVTATATATATSTTTRWRP